jgi:ACR3 family arsenite transporter
LACLHLGPASDPGTAVCLSGQGDPEAATNHPPPGAIPILIQVFFNSALAYWLNRTVGEQHKVACPSALIEAPNFFELAVAAAISLYGLESGAALATVVGVLIEVPVMLLVVRIVNGTKDWDEEGGAVSAYV